jgi:hypothetical protein
MCSLYCRVKISVLKKLPKDGAFISYFLIVYSAQELVTQVCAQTQVDYIFLQCGNVMLLRQIGTSARNRGTKPVFDFITLV